MYSAESGHSTKDAWIQDLVLWSSGESVPAIENVSSQPLQESLFQGFREESLTDCWTSDPGDQSSFPGCGPDLHICRVTKGVFGDLRVSGPNRTKTEFVLHHGWTPLVPSLVCDPVCGLQRRGSGLGTSGVHLWFMRMFCWSLQANLQYELRRVTAGVRVRSSQSEVTVLNQERVLQVWVSFTDPTFMLESELKNRI